MIVSGEYLDMDMAQKTDCKANRKVVFRTKTISEGKEIGYAFKSFRQKQPIGGTPRCRQQLQANSTLLNRLGIWRLTLAGECRPAARQAMKEVIEVGIRCRGSRSGQG